MAILFTVFFLYMPFGLIVRTFRTLYSLVSCCQLVCIKILDYIWSLFKKNISLPGCKTKTELSKT